MRFRFALSCLLAIPAAHADEVAIYRCTDAGGALTVQNMPCPKGSRQEKKLMQAVTTVPAPAAATPAPARPAPEAAPAAAATPVAPSPAPASPTPTTAAPVSGSARLPPPNLFHCSTRDEGSYITEDSEPASRCVPMQTVGLDGNPQGGAGEACEVIKDQCARVPDEALCDAWKKRRDEAEVAWRFTRPSTEEKNKAEFDRMQRILAESTCGQP